MADSLEQIGRDYAINFRRPGMTDVPTLSDERTAAELAAFLRVFPEAKRPGETYMRPRYAGFWTGWQSRAILAERPAAEPTITKRELAFALNYHSDDTRINDADWKIAGRYFDVILENRGTHPSLVERPAVSPEPSEPVAWRYRYHAKGDWHLALSPEGDPKDGTCEVQPLYVHQTARSVEAIEQTEPVADRLRAQGIVPETFLPRHQTEQAGNATQRAAGAGCKKCGGEMRPGRAILSTWGGSPDFIGDAVVVTMSPSGPGRLVDCLKCADCGWSVTS